MKKCISCQKEKSDLDFGKNKYSKDGLKKYCKDCVNMGINFKRNKKLNERQLNLLACIDLIYKKFNRFPSYSEMADMYSISKQAIAESLKKIKSRCTSIILDEEGISNIINNTKNGVVIIKFCMENGKLIRHSVASKNVKKGVEK